MPSSEWKRPDAQEFEKLVRQAALARFKRLRGFLKQTDANASSKGQLPRTNNLFSRDPKPLSSLVSDFGDIAGFSEQLAVTGLALNWVELVGVEIAQHLALGDFESETGTLQLVADSTAWATQIRMLAPALQSRINAELGEELVRSIKVDGPKPPSWTHGKRTVKGRGPRDTYG